MSPPAPSFYAPDLARYHRQILLPGIGEEGQRRLAASHAFLVGCGALGTSIADLLVRAGVGTVTIIDRDIVELTNLQRQTLFDESDARAATPKAEAAASKLAAVNSSVRVRPIVADFNNRTAEKILLDPDAPLPGVLLDGTDNFQTRYLLNDLAVRHALPYVYGGAVGTTGMSMTILPPGSLAGAITEETASACLRCGFDRPPPPGTTPTCDTAGVLGPVTVMVGAHQAAEALKLLLGRADLANPALVEFDLWENRRRGISIPRRLAAGDDPGCPCCVRRDFAFLLGDMAVGSTVLCGRNSVQINPPLELLTGRLDLATIARRLAPHGDFELTRFHLRGTFHPRPGDAPPDDADPNGESEPGAPCELTLFPDGRAIVHGTTDPAAARSVYARFVGL